jgi:hypothetical protein
MAEVFTTANAVSPAEKLLRCIGMRSNNRTRQVQSDRSVSARGLCMKRVPTIWCEELDLGALISLPVRDFKRELIPNSPQKRIPGSKARVCQEGTV